MTGIRAAHDAGLPRLDLDNHPLVLGIRGQWVIISHALPVAFMTEALSDVLAKTARAGLRPLVLTGHGAALTFATRYLVDLLGGAWRTGESAEIRSPITGQVWRAVVEAFPGSDAQASRVDPLPLAPAALAGFSVTVHHPIREDLRVGALVEDVAREIADDVPGGWHVWEPAILPWSRDRLTEYARGQMPGNVRVFVVGEQGRFRASVLVRRTSAGVEETVTGVGMVPGVSTEPDAFARLTEVGRDALAFVARSHTMPLSGVVSSVSGWPDLLHRAHRATPVTPVALLLGPQATRTLDMDVDTAARAHRVERAGRPKIPSTLVTFRPSPQGPWQEAQELLRLVGIDNVAAAAGLADTSGGGLQ